MDKKIGALVKIAPVTYRFCGVRFDRLAPKPAKIKCPNKECKKLIGEFDGVTVKIYAIKKSKN
jgi:hypothetical protein